MRTATAEYFAAKSSEEVAGDLMRAVEDFDRHLKTSGRMNLWRNSYFAYYKPLSVGGKLTRTGEQSEYTAMHANHYRNLLSHLKTMTTQQRPAFEPRATNTDYKSQAQTLLAQGLLDYYLREKKMERNIKTATEHGLVFGEGFVSAEWDATVGEDFGVDPNTGTAVKTGDIVFTNYLPFDVIRDFTRTTSEEHDWVILRSYRNRYTLAARYPELAERILAISDDPQRDEVFWRIDVQNRDMQGSDMIRLYTFYHKPTAALPEGRVVVLLDTDLVLIDSPIPYNELPVYRIAPGDQIGTIFGYTVGFDLLSIQQAIDSLYSTVLTNQSSFGVQNIAVPKGHDLSVTSLVGGLNLIEFDSKLGKPEPMNLTSTPPEIFNFMTQLERLAETLSGVNSVARGNPETSLKSGAALALVQSMAIQFSIDLQQSYAMLLEDLGTATVNLLRVFANVPRIAIIAGKSNRSLMKEFTGDDLNMINRVTVDMGNALARTTAGRVSLAEGLVQSGLMKTPEEYLSVLTTGKLDPLIDGQSHELLNIRAENEELSMGQYVQVMVTDEHQLHVREHKMLLASPEARKSPQLVQTVTQHLLEHIQVLSDPVNATLLALLGQQPAPAAPQAPPSGPGPGVEGQGQELEATNPVTQEAGKVNMPNMPQNPMEQIQ
jgi:hypothetical protein